MDVSVAVYTLIIYKIILIFIGFWSQRRTRDTEDYFLGGRNLGPVVAAISYGASSASAWTLLGMSGVTYMLGLPAIWIAAGAILGCAVAWIWIAPRLMQYTRARNQITLTEFLAENSEQASTENSAQVAKIASAIILLSFIFYIAAQFQGSATTFASVFGLPLAESLIAGAAIITIYTFLGGFWAASITDTLQGGLMLIAAILLPGTAFIYLGGWESIKGSGIFTDQSLTLTGENAGLAAAGFIAGNLAVGIGTLGQPHLLNRFMALRDQRALKTAQVLAIGWISLMFLSMFALGLMGKVLLPDLVDPEALFFELSSQLLPPFIGAILLAAVLSAIMSTADSMLLVVAATISNDLQFQRLLPGRELLLSRVSMVAVATLAVLVAMFLPATIFERVLFAWIAIGSAFAPTILARLSGIPIYPKDVTRSMITGFVLAVAFYLCPNTPGDWAERLVPFSAAMAVLLAPMLFQRFLSRLRTRTTSDPAR